MHQTWTIEGNLSATWSATVVRKRPLCTLLLFPLAIVTDSSWDPGDGTPIWERPRRRRGTTTRPITLEVHADSEAAALAQARSELADALAAELQGQLRGRVEALEIDVVLDATATRS
jgi:hypothetical protein